MTFFINVGVELAEKFDNSINIEYMPDFLENACDIQLTSPEEVASIIKGLKPNKAPGFDKVSSNMLKCNMSKFARILSHIINLSFNSGVFPSYFKKAQVIPVFKKGDLRNFNNYRPISLLNIFSKIHEKIIASRIFEHCSKYNICT